MLHGISCARLVEAMTLGALSFESLTPRHTGMRRSCSILDTRVNYNRVRDRGDSHRQSFSILNVATLTYGEALAPMPHCIKDPRGDLAFPCASFHDPCIASTRRRPFDMSARLCDCVRAWLHILRIETERQLPSRR